MLWGKAIHEESRSIMHCAFDKKEAVGKCVKCTSPVCNDCKRVLKGDVLCKKCVHQLYMRKCSLVKYDTQ